MASIGDPFTEPVPVVGTAGTGYATQINAVLNECKVRLAAKVPFSALQGNDFDLQNVPLKNAQYLGLYEQSVLPVASPEGRIEYYGDEFYLVTAAGAIKATSAGNLNASGIGGIGGDYGGANPASFRFVDLSERYEAYDNFSTLTWAYERSRGYDIAAAAISSNFCQLRYGGALTYTWTFPTTLPGSNRSVLVISSAGQVEDNDATNTITNDVILGGSTKIQHGDRTLIVPILPGQYTAGVHQPVPSSSEMGVRVTTLGIYRMAITGLQVGWRIKSFVARIFKAGATSTVINIYRYNPSSGTNTSIGSNNSTTPGRTSISHTFGTPDTVAADETFVIDWSGGDVNDSFYTLELVYDIPA